MKKIIYHLSMMLAVALCLTACDDKNDSDYVADTSQQHAGIF